MFYVNGEYVHDEHAKISVLDLGLIRGYGVFDYLRTYQGRPFHLWDHLLRLQYSAKHIGLSLPFSLSEIEKIIYELLEKNAYPESSIRILLTGGLSPDHITPQEKPNLMILIHPFTPYPSHYHSEGIKATTTTLPRSLPLSKTLQYTPAIIALQKGRLNEAQEALYLNSKSEILEATTSNFFAFDNQGNLMTPYSEEILLGITREVVLQLAASLFPLRIRPISYQEIPELSEAFITSSNKEIMPLAQIDHHPLKIGEKTQHLMQVFSEYTRRDKWDPLKIPRYL